MSLSKNNFSYKISLFLPKHLHQALQFYKKALPLRHFDFID